MNVTWKYLRENLADVINAVRYRNEVIDITRHGKVVAQLVPPAINDRPEQPQLPKVANGLHHDVLV